MTTRVELLIYWRVVNQAVIGHLLVVRDEMLPETPRNQHVASAKMTVTDSIWNHRLKTSPWVFQATWPPYDHPTTNWCSPKSGVLFTMVLEISKAYPILWR